MKKSKRKQNKSKVKGGVLRNFNRMMSGKGVSPSDFVRPPTYNLPSKRQERGR